MSGHAKSGANLRLGLVLGLALGARLLVLAFLPAQDFPDARAYAETGAALFAHGLMSDPSYMPLYPILVHLTGAGIGTRLLDIAFSVASVYLVWRLSLRLFAHEPAALLAALAAALWPHFLFFSVSGLSETSYVFLLIFAFVLFYEGRLFWGSVVLVLGVLERPTLAFVAPFLVIAFSVLVGREGWRRTALHLARLGAVFVVLMAPWWGHNYAKYHSFVLFDLGDGKALYAGNNPLNTSGGGVSDDPKGRDVDYSRFAGIEDWVARNRAMRDAALAFMAQDPARFLALAGKKFLRFWRLWPYASTYQRIAIKAVSVASYGLALALSVLFLGLEGWRRPRLLAPIYLLVVYLTFVHVVTIGSIRYRLPLEPFLIIVAAFTAVWAWERLRRPGNAGPRDARRPFTHSE